MKEEEYSTDSLMRLADFRKTVSFDCPIHGHQVYETFLGVGNTWKAPYCPECARLEKQKQETVKNISSNAIELYNALYHTLELKRPPAWEIESFDNFIADTPEKAKVLAVAKRFADRFMIREYDRFMAKERNEKDWFKINSKGLFIQGDYGTGKSHICISIAKRTHELGIPALYLRAMDLFTPIANRENRYNKKIDMQKLIFQLTEIPCLIIEELGRQSWTDYQKNILWQIFDDRMTKGRSTIVVTNLDDSELMNIIDGSIVDRFGDMMYPMKFEWPSMRGTKAINPDEVF